MGTNHVYRISGYGFDLNMGLVGVDLPFVFRSRGAANRYVAKLRKVGSSLFRFYRHRWFNTSGEEKEMWRARADRWAPYANRLWVDKVEVR